MAEKDYSEILFDAVGILLDKKIESIKFDQTLKATIVDDGAADIGKYMVSTGNAKFVAYSTETKYRNNDIVLVTIPQGDYDNQKIIVSKYVDDTTTPMVYKSPFQNIVNLSSNLIQGEHEVSFIANSSDGLEGRYWSLGDSPEFQNSAVFQGNYFMWDSGPVLYQGYTQLGLQAQFSTWLEEYNTILGNYGLALELTFKCLDVEQGQAEFTKIITFDSDEYFGDVYNFATYYTQEAVYDISDYLEYPIVRMRLFPYQRGNFKNLQGALIYKNEDLEDNLLFNTISPNIFIKDPYICLGIQTSEFTTDTATIMTDNSLSYYKGDVMDYIEDNSTNNIAELNELYTVLQEDEIFSTETTLFHDDITLADLRDYQKEYVAFLNNIPDTKNTDDWNRFKKVLRTLLRQVFNWKQIGLRWVHKDAQSDIVKVVQPGEFLKEYEIRWYRYRLGAQSPDEFAGAHWDRFYGYKSAPNPETGDWNLNSSDIQEDETLDLATNALEIAFQPNVNTQEEKIKAIVLSKEKANDGDYYIYRPVAISNILTMTNTNEVSNRATILDSNALAIKFEDLERGHYFLYNRAGKISKAKDGEIRVLTAVFDPGTDNVDEKANLTDWTSIKWTFPQGNTMIIPATSASLDATPSVEKEFINVAQVGYFINKNLNRNATNNIVTLEVVKDGATYNAQVNMLFGTAGTSGSDYTLILEWEDGKNALNMSDGFDHSLTGQVYLMDSAGENIDIPESAEIEASWYAAVGSGAPAFEVAKEEKNLYYPVLFNSSSALTSSLIAQLTGISKVIPNYYFIYNSEDSVALYKTYDLDSKDFVSLTEIDNTQILYRTRKDGESLKNKIDFEKIELTETQWNTQVNFYNRRFFVKYNDIYILDPWDSFQEVETYYYPVNTTEQRMVSNGNNNSSIYFQQDENDKTKIIIRGNNTNAINSLYILQLKLKNFGDYDLIAYYPIAVKNGEQQNNNQKTFIVDYIEGPTEVRYSTSGELDFEKNSYDIIVRQFNDNNFITLRHIDNTLAGYWKLLYPTIVSSGDRLVEDFKNNENFLPQLSEQKEIVNNDNTITYEIHTSCWDRPNPNITNDVDYQFNIPVLNPTGVYFKDAPFYGVQFVQVKDNVETILWTQPILTYQDNYPSTTLNKWNGKDILTDEDTGIISANGMSAGKKERDNTFTGVVLGDWSRTDTDKFITKQTGVYGFNHGAMSYALKDDGTAFFGKDGHGRLYFNGNKAQIYSTNWLNTSQRKNGMLIDVDDGKIHMISSDSAGTGNNITRAAITLSSTSPYFEVKDIYQKSLIYIGQNNYYLQSSNFSTTNGAEAGVKFDLSNGSLTGYNLQIRAKRTSSENYQPLYHGSYYGGYNNGWISTSRTNDDLTNAQVILDSSQSNFPFSIGSNFRVSWGGCLDASEASIEGLTAFSANISSLNATNLNAYSGNFSGGITADFFYIENSSQILGKLTSGSGAGGSGIGISTPQGRIVVTSTDSGISHIGSANSSVSCGEQGVTLSGAGININIPGYSCSLEYYIQQIVSAMNS